MKGSAFIKLAAEQDSSYEDIYTVYGVSFVKGSYLKLLNAAKTKEYVRNSSRLEDGVRYIAKPAYAKSEEKTVSMDILFEADSERDFVDKYEAFTSKVSNGEIWLKIPSKYRVFKLVYNGISPKSEYRNNRAIFTLSFIEPNPKDRIVL